MAVSRAPSPSSPTGASRFGRVASAPLLVTICGRAWRREDDARAGDLPRIWRDGGRDESDVRARAPLRRPAVTGISPRPVPARDASELTNIGWDEILADDALVLDRVAGARGRSRFRATTCRSVCSIFPTIRLDGCCTRAATYDHAGARCVDVRRRRRDSRWRSSARRGERRDEGRRARTVDAGRRVGAARRRASTSMASVEWSAAPGRGASRVCASRVLSRRASRAVSACPLFALPSMALIVGGADVRRRPISGRRRCAARRVHTSALYEVEDAETHRSRSRRRVSFLRSTSTRSPRSIGALTISPSRELGTIVSHPRARAVARLETLARRARSGRPGDAGSRRTVAWPRRRCGGKRRTADRFPRG